MGKLGIKFSNEHKKKLSLAKMGNRNPNIKSFSKILKDNKIKTLD